MVKPLARLIQRLEKVVLQQQHAVAALTEEQQQLRLRAMVASLPIRHCTALLELGAAVQRAKEAAATVSRRSGQNEEPTGSSGGGCPALQVPRSGSTSASSTDKDGSGSATLSAGPPRWRSHVLQLKTQLEAVYGGDGGSRLDVGEAEVLEQQQAPLELNWSQDAAVEYLKTRLQHGGLTSDALREVLLEYAQLGGTLLP